MPLSQPIQNQIKNDVVTLFIERLPKHDSRLNQIRFDLHEQLAIQAARTMRLFKRYEVQGISKEELLQVNYQVFSTLGLDFLADPTELLEQEYLLAITNNENIEDAETKAALTLLRFYYPYRELNLRCSELIFFNEKITRKEENLIENYLFKDSGFKKANLKSTENFNLDYPALNLIQSINNFNKLNFDQWIQIADKYDYNQDKENFKNIQAIFIKLKRDPTLTELYLLDWIYNYQYLENQYDPFFKEINPHSIKDPLVLESYKKFLLCYKNEKNDLNFRFSDLIKVANKKIDEYQRYNESDKKAKEDKKQNKFLHEKFSFRKKCTLIADNEISCHCNSIANLLKSTAVNFEKVLSIKRLSLVNSTLLKKELTLEKLKKIKFLKQNITQFSQYAKLSNIPVSSLREYYDKNFSEYNFELALALTKSQSQTYEKKELSEKDLIIIIGEKTKKPLKDHCSKADKNLLLSSFLLDKEIRRVCKQVKYLDEIGLLPSILQLETGVSLNLDILPIESLGLNATEICFSQSEDRMIAIVNPKNRDLFIKEAHKFDLEARVIGNLKKEPYLELYYRGQKVVDFSKKDLTIEKSECLVSLSKVNFLLPQEKVKNKAFSIYLKDKLKELNIACQDPLDNKLSDHIKVPDEFSIVAESNSLALMDINPYLAGYLSVYNALMKNVILGGNPETAYLSQAKILINGDDEDWSRMFFAMLGVFQARIDYKLPLIDSDDISLSKIKESSILKKNIHTKPLLISFILNHKTRSNQMSKEPKDAGLYAYLLKINETKGIPNIHETKKILNEIYLDKTWIKHVALAEKDLSTEIFKSCIRNNLGFQFSSSLKNQELFQNNYNQLIIFTKLKPESIKSSDSRLLYLGKTIKKACLERRTNKLPLKEAKNTYVRTLSNIYSNKKSSLEDLNKNNSAIDLQLIRKKINKRNAKGEIAVLSTNNLKAQLKSSNISSKVKIVIPLYQGMIGLEQLTEKLQAANVELSFPRFSFSTEEKRQQSFKNISYAIENANALVIAGGFSLHDQPKGVAKLLSLLLEEATIKEAITNLLKKQGKILGIGNGFQALISCGLLPYGRYRVWGDKQGYFKDDFLFDSSAPNVELEVISKKGNWYPQEKEIVKSVLLANYSALDMPTSLWQYCIDNQLIVTTFINSQHKYVESLVSPCGQIYGRLTHPEFQTAHIVDRKHNIQTDFLKKFVTDLKNNLTLQ